MRTALVRISTVTLDMADALDLSELLDNLDRWLAEADPTIRADLQRFATARAIYSPRLQLAGFSQLLVLGEGDVGDPDDEHEDQYRHRGWR